MNRLASSCLLAGLLLTACGDTAGELRAFMSDGCSAFPDGTLEQQELWLSCCVAHDFAYWMGGTAEQRESADIKLQSCVASVGEPTIAQLMLAGVRVGGSPWLPTEFRWGYGWPKLRGYKKLTSAEWLLVDAKLDYARLRLRAVGLDADQLLRVSRAKPADDDE